LSPYVSAWTGTNTKVGSDSNANTLTIDNLSPNNATSTSGSAGDAQVTLNWTTSNSGDFDTTSGSVILRWASGSAGSEVPAEGTDYSAGNTITTATVACAISSAGSTSQSKIDGSGGSAGCTTSALTNDQQYTYKVFQKDTRGNYDVGVLIGTFSPSAAPNPVPTTTSISPTSKNAGESEFTLTVNGTNFISGSVVKFDGSNRTTTYVSSTQLTATVPASDLTTGGIFSITVFNLSPGGGTSNAQTFTVNNLVPTTTSISPTTKTVYDSGFTLTVNGTNFVSTSVVKFDGSNRTTTYVSSTQLTATIPASDLTAAGTFLITVFNPTPGGGTSDAQTLTVNNPVPTTTSIDPTGKTVGDSEFTMTVSGTLFISSSVVRFNGSDRTTTFVNSTTLTAAIPASDIASEGTFPITVFNPTPGGGESNSQTFTISVTPPTPNPVPTLTSISPSSATQNDSEFTMTLTGTDFVSTSVARFNGVSRTTTYVSSTQLTATIPSSDLTTAGNFPITVFTPSPGGGESGSKTFTVTPAPTAPTVPLPPVGEAVRPTTIIFSGKAFPGGKMFMVDKDIRYEKTVSQDTITNDDGTFYTSFIGILQGPHSFSLIIKDKEGRGSQTKFFNINTLVQDFVVKDLIIAPTVALVAYSVTRGTATVVKGYTTPQSGVVAEIDGIIKKEAQAGQDGAYKLTIDTGPLEFGSHQMRLKQTLVGGKGESDYSPLKNFIVSRVLLPKADFNDDGAVDIRDWSIFLFHWGSKDMEKRMKIDLNNDGKIDISDFSIFVRNIRKK
ncbi:MAG: Cell surface receptor IPT/TIG domain protein, partial [Candidatus Azambacteria bacterium GW2011_GWB2_46_37]